MNTRNLLLAATILILIGCQSTKDAFDPSKLELSPIKGDQQFKNLQRISSIWEDNYRPSTGSSIFYSPSPISGSSDVIEEVVVTGSAVSSTITNNQVKGVDEGDIVKHIKDHLIVLRRGRIFSFRIEQNGAPEAHSYIDIKVPGNWEAWYDEMLVYGNQIVVIGYSYDEGATLIHRFNLDNNGKLTENDVHIFGSDDYFDFENYPSRLVGDHLHFYMPRYLEGIEGNIEVTKLVGGKPAPSVNLFESNVIYQPIQQQDEWYLHSIVSCPLNRAELRCTAKSIIGPPSSIYYIDHDSMYLWLNAPLQQFDWLSLSDQQVRTYARNEAQLEETMEQIADDAVLYQIPLGKGRPTAVQLAGWPLNQFSFQTGSSSLQILTRSHPWAPAATPVLWDIPRSSFSHEISELDAEYQTDLPRLSGRMDNNRFSNGHLIYDDYTWESGRSEERLLVLELGSASTPQTFSLTHSIDRIEPVGQNAVIIGDHNSGLGFTALGLMDRPQLGATLYEIDAEEIDVRSHSFNYTAHGETVVIGFPTITYPDGHHWNDALGIDLRFYSLDSNLNWTQLGVVNGTPVKDDADWCLVSCADWYGSARAFFIDDRIYALMDYELVSAELFQSEVIESARADGLSLVAEEQGNEL